MLIRDVAEGSNRFSLTMMKTLSLYHEELVEQEEKADKALAPVKRAMEYTSRINRDEVRNYQLFFETSTTYGRPNARVECVLCSYMAQQYVKCYHCKRAMCVMCGARSPWANIAPMCGDCIGPAQTA